MKKLFAVAFLLAGAAAAQENDRPILVISAVATPGSAGGSAGVFSEQGRLRYGLTALVTAGDSSWAGASLEARWSFLQGRSWTPYAGAGLGVFGGRRSGSDLGVQPTATAEAGFELHRFFAGARAIVPLGSRTAGAQAHDVNGLGDPALLAQLGFRI
jgi:hypothetical protein